MKFNITHFHRYSIKASVMLTLLISNMVFAEDDVLRKGWEIAQAIEDRDLGFGDSKANVKMVMVDDTGTETLREFEFRRLEVEKKGDKSLIKFIFPADIRGTALLTHPQASKGDDQWLYLPGINRTKRIQSRNKSGAFVGSEFSFEDMTDKSLEEFSYKFIKTEPCRTQNEAFEYDAICNVIERIPVDNTSGYSKQIVWADQEEYRIIRIDFYDRKETLLKTMLSSGFELFDEHYWRPKHVDMFNAQSGRKTRLNYVDISFNNGLSERDLSRRSLRGG